MSHLLTTPYGTVSRQSQGEECQDSLPTHDSLCVCRAPKSGFEIREPTAETRRQTCRALCCLRGTATHSHTQPTKDKDAKFDENLFSLFRAIAKMLILMLIPSNQQHADPHALSTRSTFIIAAQNAPIRPSYTDNHNKKTTPTQHDHTDNA